MLYELDDDFRPVEEKLLADRYLGDVEAAKAAAEAVARQAGAPPDSDETEPDDPTEDAQP
jgi:hypothetical protein